MDGTVFYDSNNKRWIARYPAGRFNTPKPIAGYGQTREKAIQRRDKALKRALEGTQYKTRKDSVRSMLDRYFQWLDGRTATRANTLAKKKERLNRYLKPYYSMSMKDFNEPECIAILKAGRQNSKNSENSKIEQDLYSELRQFSKWLLNRKLIDEDFMRFMEKPKYSSGTRQANEMHIDERIAMGRWLLNWTSENIKTNSIDYGMMMIASLGLRAGEIRGLEWKCFKHLLDGQFDDTTLIIQQQWDRDVNTGEWRLYMHTKSNAKTWREIAIPKTWAYNLFSYYEYEQDRLHHPYDYDGFLFLNDKGTPLTKNQQQKRWNDLKAKYIESHPKTADIDRTMRIHDMRHVVASLLIENGATMAQIQPIMGWMNSQMAEYYTHLSQKFGRETMNKIPEILNHETPDTINFLNAMH